MDIPDPLPVPTDKQIRDIGFSGDITRFPLTRDGFIKRCEMNGVDPSAPPSPAWYYAPNPYVQMELCGGTNLGPICANHEGENCRFCDGQGRVESFEVWKMKRSK